MATVINNQVPENNGGMGFLLGIILLVVVLILVLYYSMPLLRNIVAFPQPQMPNNISINVNPNRQTNTPNSGSNTNNPNGNSNNNSINNQYGFRATNSPGASPSASP